MKQELVDLEKTSQHELATIGTLHELDQAKARLLGKKSPLTTFLKQIPTLPMDQRRTAGQHINRIKHTLSEALDQKRHTLLAQQRQADLANPGTDSTLPAFGLHFGQLHPLTQASRRICSLLKRLGFAVKQGPTIEDDFHNFEALNIPADHPARDMHDTFYLKNNGILRTHTSPVQIREMIQQPPPIRMIAPGKVYRCDADTSHSPVFHQIEGLYVDRGVTFADLKGTLSYILGDLFGNDKAIRFRSSYFPFTEPSVEVDVAYTRNGQTQWLEIMGAGLVQRKVFSHVNYDADAYSGFAFGLGIERVAMLLYGVDDIRLFYENDSHFLKQF